MTEYPEHEKLIAVKHLTEAIHAFHQWVRDETDGEVYLARELNDDGLYSSDFAMRSLSKNEYDGLLAKHFGIDLKALEQEKQAMLDKVRAAHG